MENASKALMIAAGILIALIIITLLVTYYDKIKELMGIKETVEVSEQALEFNKQFDTYNRNNLYGSDILSLVNKVCDYNKKQADEQGYQKIEMEITFTSSYQSYDGTEIIKENKKYNSTEIQAIIADLETQIDKYTSAKTGYVKKYISSINDSSTTIASLSGYRTNELEEYLKKQGIEDEDKREKVLAELQKEINRYLRYKTTLSTIKSKTFKTSKFEYDKNTGRITKMIFVQN